MTELTKSEASEFFTFLDELRQSGETNMFGVAPYLEASFTLSRADTKTVLTAWMQTFQRERACHRIRRPHCGGDRCEQRHAPRLRTTARSFADHRVAWRWRE